MRLSKINRVLFNHFSTEFSCELMRFEGNYRFLSSFIYFLRT